MRHWSISPAHVHAGLPQVWELEHTLSLLRHDGTRFDWPILFEGQVNLSVQTLFEQITQQLLSVPRNLTVGPQRLCRLNYPKHSRLGLMCHAAVWMCRWWYTQDHTSCKQVYEDKRKAELVLKLHHWRLGDV